MGGRNHRALYTCMKLSTKLISNEVSSLIPKTEATKWWLSRDSQDSLSFTLSASIHVLPVHARPLSVLRNFMRHHYCVYQDGSGACPRIPCCPPTAPDSLSALPHGSPKTQFSRFSFEVAYFCVAWAGPELGMLLPQLSECYDYRHMYHTQLSICSILSLKMGTLYSSSPE